MPNFIGGLTPGFLSHSTSRAEVSVAPLVDLDGAFYSRVFYPESSQVLESRLESSFTLLCHAPAPETVLFILMMAA